MDFIDFRLTLEAAEIKAHDRTCMEGSREWGLSLSTQARDTATTVVR